MENQGWVCLHRKILDNTFCKSDIKKLGFWVYLLLQANHSTNKFLHGNTLIECKEGQFITGRVRLSEETGLKEGQIELWLNVLESMGQIQQQKTNKFRLITIKNWHKYQEMLQQNDNKIATKRQQNDTNNNVNNDNNENNIKVIGRFAPPSLADVKAYCIERRNGIDPEAFIAFYESKGWMIGKNKMKSWQSAIITWEKRTPQFRSPDDGDPLLTELRQKYAKH